MPHLCRFRRNFLALALSFATATIAMGSALGAQMTEVDAATAFSQGVTAYNRADYTEAIRLLSIKARKDPGDGTVYYYLGNCYMQQHQSEQAAQMYAACVRISATSPAGKYSLKALETIATLPKAPPPAKPEQQNPAAVEAAKDALLSDKPVDQAYKEALAQIKNERSHFKGDVDRVWDNAQEDLLNLNRRSNTYQYDLERLRRETETKLQAMQTKELRRESRILAPDKIDVRAVPQIPTGKVDDTANALGTLMDYSKPEKPFDPMGIEVTPEMTEKFMTMRDAFGDISTYQTQARKLARDTFKQLKSTIESKQDSLDRQITDIKENLIKDIINTKISQTGNGKTNPGSPLSQLTPQYALSQMKIPRSSADYQQPMDYEIARITERAQKRIKELQDGYNRDVDGAISGAKERLSSLVGPGLGSQFKHANSSNQVVPLGLNVYTRNYVNFGDHAPAASSSSNSMLAHPPVTKSKTTNGAQK